MAKHLREAKKIPFKQVENPNRIGLTGLSTYLVQPTLQQSPPCTYKLIMVVIYLLLLKLFVKEECYFFKMWHHLRLD